MTSGDGYPLIKLSMTLCELPRLDAFKFFSDKFHRSSKVLGAVVHFTGLECWRFQFLCFYIRSTKYISKTMEINV